MKPSMLLITLLLSAGVAFADNYSTCNANLQSIEDQMLPAASNLAKTNLPIAVIVTHEVPVTYEGYADSDHNRVYLNPRICSYPLSVQRTILAHETGHIIGHNLHPNIKADAQRGRYGRNVHEGIADQYGSRVLTALGWLNDSIADVKAACDEATTHETASTTKASFTTSDGPIENSCSHLAAFLLSQSLHPN